MILYEQEKITIATDLVAIDSSEVIRKIKDSKTIENAINTIRSVEDKKERNKYKRENLPYFVWAKFKNGVRDLEHFQETWLIGFDIDGDDTDAETITELKTEICKDNRIWMCFISPSGNGLKIWYRFHEPVQAIKIYRQIYEQMSEMITKRYNLKKYNVSVDPQTIDVSRACFYSHDDEPYLNEDCETIAPIEFLVPVSTPEKITGVDIYNFSEQAYQDIIEIMQMKGYEIRAEDEEKCYMGRINADGKSDHNSLTVFRHIDTPDGSQGRAGLYLFSTSDPDLLSSDERKRKGMVATYSATDLLMRFKFDNEHELISYVNDKGFETGKIRSKFESASVATQIISVLRNKYEFMYDTMAKRLFVSKYGKDWELYDDMVEYDIKTTLIEAGVKNFADNYYGIIVSRMAKVIDPIKKIINNLEAMDSVDYDPIKKLLNQFQLNYDLINIKLTYEETKKLHNINNRIELAELDKASDDELDKLYNERDRLIYKYTKEKADKYIYNGLKKWFMSAVASWVLPNASNEIVVILQGQKQGTGKTRMLRTWLPSFIDRRYYSEQLKQNGEFGKDTMMHVAGSLLINIDEMTALRGTDIDKFKSLVSATHLSFRVPYGRVVANTRKYCSFVGTTNYENFLSDKTGNRRYVIIPIKSVNYMHNVNIDQCYKFAYDLVKKGEPYWIENIEEVNSINNQYQYDTYYEDSIHEYFEPCDWHAGLEGRGKEQNIVYLQLHDIYDWIFGKQIERREYSRFRRAVQGMGFNKGIKRVPYYSAKTARVYALKAKKLPYLHDSRLPDSIISQALNTLDKNNL